MNTIGIFYGSTSGNTQGIAQKIATKLSVETKDIHDVGTAKADDLKNYNLLLLGCSTWGAGDLQDDWESFIDIIASADLSEKKVALFGCGDSFSYSDSFCDALGKIYHAIKDKTTVIGFMGTDGYSFETSESVVNNQFVGLLLDEDNEKNCTEDRINNWIAQLKKEL
jgi:flavodoxin I